MDKLFAVLDGGTQNVKAFLIDANGFVRAEKIYPAVPYTSSKVDFAEQDAESYLALAKKAMREVVKGAPQDALYEEVYKSVYPSLKNLYHKIDEIVKFKNYQRR